MRRAEWTHESFLSTLAEVVEHLTSSTDPRSERRRLVPAPSQRAAISPLWVLRKAGSDSSWKSARPYMADANGCSCVAVSSCDRIPANWTSCPYSRRRDVTMTDEQPSFPVFAPSRLSGRSKTNRLTMFVVTDVRNFRL